MREYTPEEISFAQSHGIALDGPSTIETVKGIPGLPSDYLLYLTKIGENHA